MSMCIFVIGIYFGAEEHITKVLLDLEAFHLAISLIYEICTFKCQEYIYIFLKKILMISTKTFFLVGAENIFLMSRQTK